MKQAVRDNRQGKICIALELLRDETPGVALLRSRMAVCGEVADYLTGCVWLVGYAPEFDALELGEQPPEYDAILTHESVADAPALSFRRRPPPAPRPRDALDEQLSRLLDGRA